MLYPGVTVLTLPHQDYFLIIIFKKYFWSSSALHAITYKKNVEIHDAVQKMTKGGRVITVIYLLTRYFLLSF